MNKYLTYRETDSGNRLCYYILQKEFPHYKALLSVGKIEDALVSMPILGYNLYVNFNGVLRGNLIPNYNNVMDEIKMIMDEMADWFYHNRILIEPKKYNKFKNI